MATFLELVKDLARESGTASPSAITSVIAQTGRTERMVNWVNKAWLNIQNSRRDWYWMRAETTAELIAGNARYTGAGSFSLPRFGEWLPQSDFFQPVTLYDPAIGVADEGPITQIGYDQWYTMYGRGSHDENRPVHWAISPAGELCLGPTPDDEYVIRFSYLKSPQSLTDNSDIPELPTRYHELITFEARRLLLIHDGAFNESGAELPEIARLRFELERSQLPDVTIGGTTIG